MSVVFRHRKEESTEEELETREILSNPVLMQLLRESLRDLQEGRYKVFDNLDEAFKWLDSPLEEEEMSVSTVQQVCPRCFTQPEVRFEYVGEELEVVARCPKCGWECRIRIKREKEELSVFIPILASILSFFAGAAIAVVISNLMKKESRTT